MIRPVNLDDAARLSSIYNHYIEKTTITFEEEPIGASEMCVRISTHPGSHPWLVAEGDGEISGYAYASPWHRRSAYRKSVETAVYVAHDRVGSGIGSALFRALLEVLRKDSFHCIFGLVALPNPPSVALVEKFGFQRAGELREVGWKFNRWVNVGVWQLLI